MIPVRVAIIGAGPAGLGVATRLLAEAGDSLHIDILDRDARPDALLRHGPAAGADRLLRTAAQVDAVLAHPRSRYFGGVAIGENADFAALTSAYHAVVIATGAPTDLPLSLPGDDAVGVGTLSHIEGWLAGGSDVDADELDLEVDSAILVGWSARTVRAARILARVDPIPTGTPAAVSRRLAASGLRRVTIVDARDRTDLDDVAATPDAVTVAHGLTPIAVVGRNRARALRTLRRAADGRTLVTDVRAQLLARPFGPARHPSGLDADGAVLTRVAGRAVRDGAPQNGVYLAGWVARSPGVGSHAADHDAVLTALDDDLTAGLAAATSDVDRLPAAAGSRPLTGWSAVEATERLLERFATEGTHPLADYHRLVDEADDD
ncbi:FAD-dependent oxidoreductase [Nocardia harenae]|uniref:FAD-dependent oxidoreductase n=1 Tax=Nocardia harenae TaxID=358707 RepID=UPI000AC7C5B9|nr:FAD-dependent oxidoreductase [Nocardia harenae]